MPTAADSAQTDVRTLFVRNVAFDVDAAQLEEVFTDIGPVRQCFLVTDKQQQQQGPAAGSQKRHKGIAFVQYAIPEDAERALEELNGKEVAGRRLKIDRALKRAPLQERKQKKRQAAEQHDDKAAPTEQQQQQQADDLEKKIQAAPTAAAAAESEQPPAKRVKSSKQQQQQQHAAADTHVGAPAGTAADKHKWLRTVALGVPNPGVYLQTAKQLAAACGGLTEVLNPAPADVVSRAHLTQDGCSGHVVFLVYEDVKAASHAVTQLHGKQLTPAALAAAAAAAATAAGSNVKDKKHKKLGRKEAKRLAKQQQQEAAAAAAVAAAAAAASGSSEDAAAAAAGVLLWGRVVSGEGARVKKWRIILRNLAFQATEAELRKLLSSSGAFVWDLQLPRGPDGRTRGFAFASFTSYPEAEKAIKAVNGQQLRKRPVAADWAIGKAQYEGLKQQQQQQPAAAAGSSGGIKDGGSGSKRESEMGSEGESEEGSGLSDTDEQESEDEEQLESDESAEDDVIGSEDDVSSSEDDVSGSGSESEEEEEEEEGAAEDADVQADRDTVAHALDAVLKRQQQQQQQQHQQGGKAAAGDNKAAKQQQQQQQQSQERDQQQQQPGSAAVSRTVFVRGLPLDVTQQELQARFDCFGPVKACRVVLDKTTGKPKGTAFIEFKTPDPAAAAATASARAWEGKGQDVTVKGVTLTVDLALTQDDARRLGSERGVGVGGQGSAGAGGKFDRRNLYLVKEGFVEEGSTVWTTMSENDRRKRKRAAEEKNQKLKSPNFAVSTTRLAVRNIPPSWDEKRLKASFIVGVKERATKENPKVVQVKILRDTERADAAGHPGGRSRGFGFVEFSDHTHALAALRQLNNNPKVFGSTERRPIVEFAVDNVKVLRLRQDKLMQQKQQRQQRQQEQQQRENGQAGNAAAEGAESDPEEGPGFEGGKQAAAAAAAGEAPQAKGGRQQGKGAAVAAKGKQQQQQQQDGQGAGEQLTKRQLKRLKEKEKRLDRQQQQQQNGVAATPKLGAAAKQQQQQRGGKKGAAAAAAAAASAAAASVQAARLAAKSARQQKQAAAEEAIRGQKRRADDLLDRLAASAKPQDGGLGRRQQQGGKRQRGQLHGEGDGGVSGSNKKRHKPGRAAEERLERLVDDYKAKLFGLGGGAGGKQQQSQQQQQHRSLQRWFE